MGFRFTALALVLTGCASEIEADATWVEDEGLVRVEVRGDPGTGVSATAREIDASGACVLDDRGLCTIDLAARDLAAREAALTTRVDVYADDAEPARTLTVSRPFAFRLERGAMRAPGTDCTFRLDGGSLRYRDCPEGTTIRVGDAAASDRAGTLAIDGPFLLAPGVDLAALFPEDDATVALPVTVRVEVPRAGDAPLRWEGPLSALDTPARGVLGAEALAGVDRAREVRAGAGGVLAVQDVSGRAPPVRRFGEVARLEDVREIVRLRAQWRDAGSCGLYRVTTTGSDGVMQQGTQPLRRRARDVIAEAFGADGSIVASERFEGERPSCPERTERVGDVISFSIDGAAPWAQAWAWAESRASAAPVADGAGDADVADGTDAVDVADVADGTDVPHGADVAHVAHGADGAGSARLADAAAVANGARAGADDAPDHADRDRGRRAPASGPAERRARAGASAGALSQPQIRSVVGRHGRALRGCYERGAATNPELAGQLLVRWRVDASGAVETPRVESDTLGSEPVRACVLSVVSRMRFPSSADGADVRYPFAFRPG